MADDLRELLDRRTRLRSAITEMHAELHRSGEQLYRIGTALQHAPESHHYRNAPNPLGHYPEVQGGDRVDWEVIQHIPAIEKKIVDLRAKVKELAEVERELKQAGLS